MNKETLRHAILLKLEDQLQLAIKAANEARDLAIHEQSQPETQYDTVGLEASYLAHGQSQRVFDLEVMIQTYRKQVFRAFTDEDEIALTALVHLQYPDARKAFFIGPCAGGLECNVDGEIIQLLTPQAPLARQLLGAFEGDEIMLPGQDTLIEILSVS
ncbi:transcription elongation factor GreAB [Litoribrevibacter albus]|uniref:Transcription elongation factor GreAB n=1 Tax=Litoribrevibacter albus TaxID=1473156 RepID=A0AA37SE68_9GAMM|nr:transcription elongation factor GreAB [Litoribrevibacter albus]GLQ32642.1 hypothetical protein GCM10007876_31210 [Litoribrevibacter albus]